MYGMVGALPLARSKFVIAAVSGAFSAAEKRIGEIGARHRRIRIVAGNGWIVGRDDLAVAPRRLAHEQRFVDASPCGFHHRSAAIR